MKKITLAAILCLALSIYDTTAQRTFETLLDISKINGAEQNPDGTYIVCLDSNGGGLMKLDACGNRMWVSFPTVRTSDEKIYDVAPDPFTGGYIAGGASPDSTGTFGSEPTLLLLDANGNLTGSRVLPPGDMGGAVYSVRSSAGSGYVAGIFLDMFGGSDASSFSKVDLTLSDVWDANGGGSNINSSSVNLNSAAQYLFSSFSVVGATAPAIRQLDSLGMTLNTFVVPDTFQGGGMFFHNAVVDDSPDGNYFIGATLSPGAASYDYPYVVKLDDMLNVMWQKIFDWGRSAEVLSVLSTPDNGAMCLINQMDTVIFLRLSSTGDSLWSRTYSGIGTVAANRIRHCMDGGYLLNGSTSDGVNTYGLILKLDSLAMLLPPVCVQSGASTVICPGTDVTLSVDSGYTYLWSTNETTQSITVDTAGVYYVIVTDTSSGLSAQSENVEITFYNTSVPVINMLGNFLVSTPAITYQWLFNGDTIVGETGSDITPQFTGDYSVRITDSNGCVLTSALFPYIMPGVAELNNEVAFRIKRINKDVVELFLNSKRSGTIRLIDIRGLLVKEMNVNNSGERTLQIPVSDLATGIYSLVWYSEKSVQVEKILIGN